MIRTLIVLLVVVGLGGLAFAPTSADAQENCHPSYEGVCLQQGIGDYDCAGGTGDGPNFVDYQVMVVGDDEFGLDSDGDGLGCESLPTPPADATTDTTDTTTDTPTGPELPTTGIGFSNDSNGLPWLMISLGLGGFVAVVVGGLVGVRRARI